MIRVIATSEAELAHLWTRHDFAPLFNMPYKVFLQRPDGRIETIGGGGITSTSFHAGPASLTRGGGAGGTGTTTNGKPKRGRR